MSVKKEMETLSKEMSENPDYAHSWHCNLAMACQDAGASYEVGNEAASRFMRQVFDVKTSADMLTAEIVESTD